MAVIRVEHPNGYAGVLYGKSSMAVYGPKGNEVLHTGSRNINNSEDLYSLLEGMPEFVNKAKEVLKDDKERSTENH